MRDISGKTWTYLCKRNNKEYTEYKVLEFKNKLNELNNTIYNRFSNSPLQDETFRDIADDDISKIKKYVELNYN